MINSLQDKRFAVMAHMVTKSSKKTLGRTQVMKFLYFLQELKGVSLGYDFRLFTYGPFDADVLNDLATACNLNAIQEKTVIFSRGYGYEITPGPQAERLSCELRENDRNAADQIDAIVSEFGEFPAAELELRSTIVFVDRELLQTSSKLAGEDFAERVRQIKPHFSGSTILDRIQDMNRKHEIRCVSA